MKIPTSLPWKIGGIVNDMSDDGEDDLIVESKSLEICQVFGGIIPAIHDAEYIVTACNMFPELVGCVEDALGAFEHNNVIDWDRLTNALEKIKT